jgi:RHS repeat-associated protein
MYVSNESPTLVDVYFDDVVMTHTKGNLIQYNEYYPFGLQTANSWTRENVTGNNFLGNGGTELNTTSNLYDLDYRNYDPILGRMNGVDPMATKYASLTPYNFSFNDPVTFNDPSGADPDYGITRYTYDDRVDHYRGEFYSGGSTSTMSFHFGGGLGIFDSFNAYVHGRVQLSSIIKGTNTALKSKFGGSVNVQNGAFTPFLNYIQSRNAGARYVNSTNGWDYISGGKADYLERIRPEGTVIRGSIFVDETISNGYDQAKSYLGTSKRAQRLMSYIEENAIGLEIWDLASSAKYYESDNVVVWDPRWGLSLNEGFNSPSLLLVHELFHAYQDIAGITVYQPYNKSKWQDGFERFATARTNGVARSLHQGVRRGYLTDGGMRYFKGVNDFIPDNSRGTAIERNLYIMRQLSPAQQKRSSIY